VHVGPQGRADVRALAGADAVLVVNTRDRPVVARVDGKRVKLAAYQVKWLDRHSG
jgi:hypothetical protein